MSCLENIDVISDEDKLRQMWKEEEDPIEKRRIRSRMYELREQRLREVHGYNGQQRNHSGFRTVVEEDEAQKRKQAQIDTDITNSDQKRFDYLEYDNFNRVLDRSDVSPLDESNDDSSADIHSHREAETTERIFTSSSITTEKISSMSEFHRTAKLQSIHDVNVNIENGKVFVDFLPDGLTRSRRQAVLEYEDQEPTMEEIRQKLQDLGLRAPCDIDTMLADSKKSGRASSELVHSSSQQKTSTMVREFSSSEQPLKEIAIEEVTNDAEIEINNGKIVITLEPDHPEKCTQMIWQFNGTKAPSCEALQEKLVGFKYNDIARVDSILDEFQGIVKEEREDQIEDGGRVIRRKIKILLCGDEEEAAEARVISKKRPQRQEIHLKGNSVYVWSPRTEIMDAKQLFLQYPGIPDIEQLMCILENSGVDGLLEITNDMELSISRAEEDAVDGKPVETFRIQLDETFCTNSGIISPNLQIEITDKQINISYLDVSRCEYKLKINCNEQKWDLNSFLEQFAQSPTETNLPKKIFSQAIPGTVSDETFSQKTDEGGEIVYRVVCLATLESDAANLQRFENFSVEISDEKVLIYFKRANNLEKIYKITLEGNTFDSDTLERELENLKLFNDKQIIWIKNEVEQKFTGNSKTSNYSEIKFLKISSLTKTSMTHLNFFEQTHSKYESDQQILEDSVSKTFNEIGILRDDVNTRASSQTPSKNGLTEDGNDSSKLDSRSSSRRDTDSLQFKVEKQVGSSKCEQQAKSFRQNSYDRRNSILTLPQGADIVLDDRGLYLKVEPNPEDSIQQSVDVGYEGASPDVAQIEQIMQKVRSKDWIGLDQVLIGLGAVLVEESDEESETSHGIRFSRRRRRYVTSEQNQKSEMNESQENMIRPDSVPSQGRDYCGNPTPNQRSRPFESESIDTLKSFGTNDERIAVEVGDNDIANPSVTSKPRKLNVKDNNLQGKNSMNAETETSKIMRKNSGDTKIEKRKSGKVDHKINESIKSNPSKKNDRNDMKSSDGKTTNADLYTSDRRRMVNKENTYHGTMKDQQSMRNKSNIKVDESRSPTKKLNISSRAFSNQSSVKHSSVASAGHVNEKTRQHDRTSIANDLLLATKSKTVDTRRINGRNNLDSGIKTKSKYKENSGSETISGCITPSNKNSPISRNSRSPQKTIRNNAATTRSSSAFESNQAGRSTSRPRKKAPLDTGLAELRRRRSLKSSESKSVSKSSGTGETSELIVGKSAAPKTSNRKISNKKEDAVHTSPETPFKRDISKKIAEKPSQKNVIQSSDKDQVLKLDLELAENPRTNGSDEVDKSPVLKEFEHHQTALDSSAASVSVKKSLFESKIEASTLVQTTSPISPRVARKPTIWDQNIDLDSPKNSSARPILLSSPVSENRKFFDVPVLASENVLPHTISSIPKSDCTMSDSHDEKYIVNMKEDHVVRDNLTELSLAEQSSEAEIKTPSKPNSSPQCSESTKKTSKIEGTDAEKKLPRSSVRNAKVFSEKKSRQNSSTTSKRTHDRNRSPGRHNGITNRHLSGRDESKEDMSLKRSKVHTVKPINKETTKSTSSKLKDSQEKSKKKLSLHDCKTNQNEMNRVLRLDGLDRKSKNGGIQEKTILKKKSEADLDFTSYSRTVKKTSPDKICPRRKSYFDETANAKINDSSDKSRSFFDKMSDECTLRQTRAPILSRNTPKKATSQSRKVEVNNIKNKVACPSERRSSLREKVNKRNSKIDSNIINNKSHTGIVSVVDGSSKEKSSLKSPSLVGSMNVRTSTRAGKEKESTYRNAVSNKSSRPSNNVKLNSKRGSNTSILDKLTFLRDPGSETDIKSDGVRLSGEMHRSSCSPDTDKQSSCDEEKSPSIYDSSIRRGSSFRSEKLAKTFEKFEHIHSGVANVKLTDSENTKSKTSVSVTREKFEKGDSPPSPIFPKLHTISTPNSTSKKYQKENNGVNNIIHLLNRFESNNNAVEQPGNHQDPDPTERPTSNMVESRAFIEIDSIDKSESTDLEQQKNPTLHVQLVSPAENEKISGETIVSLKQQVQEENTNFHDHFREKQQVRELNVINKNVRTVGDCPKKLLSNKDDVIKPEIIETHFFLSVNSAPSPVLSTLQSEDNIKQQDDVKTSLLTQTQTPVSSQDNANAGKQATVTSQAKLFLVDQKRNIEGCDNFSENMIKKQPQSIESGIVYDDCDSVISKTVNIDERKSHDHTVTDQNKTGCQVVLPKMEDSVDSSGEIRTPSSFQAHQNDDKHDVDDGDDIDQASAVQKCTETPICSTSTQSDQLGSIPNDNVVAVISRIEESHSSVTENVVDKSEDREQNIDEILDICQLDLMLSAAKEYEKRSRIRARIRYLKRQQLQETTATQQTKLRKATPPSRTLEKKDSETVYKNVKLRKTTPLSKTSEKKESGVVYQKEELKQKTPHAAESKSESEQKNQSEELRATTQKEKKDELRSNHVLEQENVIETQEEKKDELQADSEYCRVTHSITDTVMGNFEGSTSPSGSTSSGNIYLDQTNSHDYQESKSVGTANEITESTSGCNTTGGNVVLSEVMDDIKEIGEKRPDSFTVEDCKPEDIDTTRDGTDTFCSFSSPEPPKLEESQGEFADGYSCNQGHTDHDVDHSPSDNEIIQTEIGELTREMNSDNETTVDRESLKVDSNLHQPNMLNDGTKVPTITENLLDSQKQTNEDTRNDSVACERSTPDTGKQENSFENISTNSIEYFKCEIERESQVHASEFVGEVDDSELAFRGRHSDCFEETIGFSDIVEERETISEEKHIVSDFIATEEKELLEQVQSEDDQEESSRSESDEMGAVFSKNNIPKIKKKKNKKYQQGADEDVVTQCEEDQRISGGADVIDFHCSSSNHSEPFQSEESAFRNSRSSKNLNQSEEVGDHNTRSSKTTEEPEETVVHISRSWRTLDEPEVIAVHTPRSLKTTEEPEERAVSTSRSSTQDRSEEVTCSADQAKEASSEGEVRRQTPQVDEEIPRVREPEWLKRSCPPREKVDTSNSIEAAISSYGPGPTDEHGRPLFGLRALRRQTPKEEPSLPKESESSDRREREETVSVQQNFDRVTTKREETPSNSQNDSFDFERDLPLFGGLRALRSRASKSTSEERTIIESEHTEKADCGTPANDVTTIRAKAREQQRQLIAETESSIDCSTIAETESNKDGSTVDDVAATTLIQDGVVDSTETARNSERRPTGILKKPPPQVSLSPASTSLDDVHDDVVVQVEKEEEEQDDKTTPQIDNSSLLLTKSPLIQRRSTRAARRSVPETSGSAGSKSNSDSDAEIGGEACDSPDIIEEQQTYKSFLDDSSPVTGITDVLSRMKAPSSGANTPEDEGCALLNKFLGAQVLMSGADVAVRQEKRTTKNIDGSTSILAVSDGGGSSFADDTAAHEDSATSGKQSLRSPPDVICGVDINKVNDRAQLKVLLESCGDFDQRRRIRARSMALLEKDMGGRPAERPKNREEFQQQRDGGCVTTQEASFITKWLEETTTTTGRSSVAESRVSSSSLHSSAMSSASPRRNQADKNGVSVSPFDKFRQMDSATSTSKSSSKSLSSQSDLGFRMDNGLASKAQSAKDMMLYWCQCRLRGYKNVTVENFSTSWNDGMAFCALIHHFYPEAFDFESLDPKNRRQNFQLAFSTADELAGVYPLLDVDDMVRMRKPDWKCVFTYVQTLYNRLKDGA